MSAIFDDKEKCEARRAVGSGTEGRNRGSSDSDQFKSLDCAVPEPVMSETATSEARPTSMPPSNREIRITDGAVAYANKRLTARGTADAAVRLGVRGGGCSGFNYVSEFF